MRVAGLQSRSAHRLLGSIVALLMLFQSVGALAAAHQQFAHTEAAPGVATAPSFDVSCLGGGETPSRDRHDCSDRCVLCCVRDCHALSFHSVADIIDAYFETFGSPDPVARSRLADDDGDPLGWTSSWSSRAPPSLS
ncbi:hypothetical+protein [Methylocapsa aurea]